MATRREALDGAATALLLGLAAGSFLASPAQAQGTNQAGATAQPKRMVTQGLAKTVTDNLFKCEVKVTNHRISAVGTITASDGTVLTVPAETQFQKAQKIPDLFNECNNVTPQRLAEAKDKDVPVVEVDPDGEVVTGYIVADNY